MHIPENTIYTYPDISIICGDPHFTDKQSDTITSPSALREILSKSTRDYDRLAKFHLYRSIQILKEYILVDSTSISIDSYFRNNDNSWTLIETKEKNTTLFVKTIVTQLLLENIYENVIFK
jgi:Uma2 family endonuclease